MAYEQNHYQPPARPYNGSAARRPVPPQGPQQGYNQLLRNNTPHNNTISMGRMGTGTMITIMVMRKKERGCLRGAGEEEHHQCEEHRQCKDHHPLMELEADTVEPQDQEEDIQMLDPLEGEADHLWTEELTLTQDEVGQQRRPLKTPPISPDNPSSTFDNPFPSFPGGKKKTSLSEEQNIVQKMAKIEVGPPPQNRPRGPGSKGSRDKYPMGAPTDDYGRPSLEGQRRGPPADDYGRPLMERRPAPNDYGRHSADNQRRPPDDYERQSAESTRSGPPRGYPPQRPPQQGYPQPRRGPPPGQGYGPPQQNGYGDPGYDDRGGYDQASAPPAREDFVPPGRSMTMPNQPPQEMGRKPQMPRPMEGPGPSAPYNGPVGRGMPPRPSTASGGRPPPQKQYPSQPPLDLYANGQRHPSSQGYYTHQNNGSIDELYDAYYDSPGGAQRRPQSAESEMPDFDAVPIKPSNHRRGASIDGHIQLPPAPLQPGFKQQVKPVKSQPDIRHRAQPQAAVFEMADEAPPFPSGMPHPNAYPEKYDDGYGPDPYGMNPGPAFVPYETPPPNGFQPPPRSASAAPRAPGGLPNGPRGGLPNGPSPNGGPPRSNTMPRSAPPNMDALPSHPPPVRAGLIPNSVASLASNKPTPVRNYGGIAPAPPPQQAPQPQIQAPQGPARPPSEAHVPVTAAELEQLRSRVKNNPNDQATQLLLARKLVEASEVLVPAIPDQRQRNKTRERYVMDAHKHLKKLVTLNNAEAMFYLADCHGRGSLGLEPDNKEAFSLYQSAAKAGHAAAAYRTAVCCELGNEDGGGTRKDPIKAIQWYKRAATLGDTPAMYKMGMIQLKGLLGQSKSPREAVGWLKRAAQAADAENPHALHELGLLYEAPQTDSSVIRDEAYSFGLFQQAADLGYKFSQFRLGCAFEYGLFNCPIDARQSIMWYSRAAAQEEHQSELALSGWYLTGSDGVLQQSDTEAYLWARKAGMAGLAKAEYAMGYFTEVGIGSPANLEDAKRWYWRAAAQNFPKARERLEDLKKGGGKAGLKSRERISRSKVGKQNEGECSVM
ncbi:Chitin synthase regulatory factor [Lachnellula willkommii]|uniref:Chitin synthase regulatory factor n=1 Tax=Lachnellula willkommii TaxID=215461 RepID=A0A559M5E2_9HELO|nr:Chitin synthase regulatory factor [Lachnellula willkommii]